MKPFALNHSVYLTIAVCLCLVAGCKKVSSTTEETKEDNFIPKDVLADLAYNPIKRDGTIDSSYIPIIRWDETVFDFGTIRQGQIVEKKFYFKNIGTAPLVILTATSTCGCTIPEWPKTHILPDSIGFILVRYKSENKEGPQNKEVTIFANTIPNQSKINIKGKVEKTN